MNKKFLSSINLESNPTLETIFSHFSVRDYTENPLSDDMVKLLVCAGQAASTYAHTMNTSVIRITDKDLREELAKIAHQGYVASAAEFFVFCVDFSRIKELNPKARLDTSDVLLTGAIDAGVFAQNMLLAAESLGYGGIYIGALRHDLPKVDSLLNLPKYVVPLFGLCIGHSDSIQKPRPRLPVSAVLKNNTYSPISADDREGFDAEMKAFSLETTGQEKSWNQRVPFIFNEPMNPDALAYYQSKGFMLDAKVSEE